MNNQSDPSRLSSRPLNRDNEVPYSPGGTGNQAQLPHHSNLHNNTSALLNSELVNPNQQFDAVPRWPAPPPGTINPLQLHSSTYYNPRDGPFRRSGIFPAPLPLPGPLTSRGPETIPTYALFCLRAEREQHPYGSFLYLGAELKYVNKAIQILVALRQCRDKFSDNFVKLAAEVGMSAEDVRWNKEFLGRREAQHVQWKKALVWGAYGHLMLGQAEDDAAAAAAEKDKMTSSEGTCMVKETGGDSAMRDKESDETRTEKAGNIQVQDS